MPPDHKHLQTSKHFLETFLKHFTLLAPVRTASLQSCKMDTSLLHSACKQKWPLQAGGCQQARGGEGAPQPHGLMHRNGNADGGHKSRCRQRQVSNAVRANKSRREQQGKAGVQEWGRGDEILVVIVLQVSSQEIKCWHRGRPHPFCLNLTAKSFATSIL